MLEVKKQCPTTLSSIELTDTVKHHVIEFRIYNKNQSTSQNHEHTTSRTQLNRLQKEVEKLKFKVDFLRKKKPKSFFQQILERHYNASHKCIPNYGITDITTADMHIEIKNWNYWYQAVGQILYYNMVDPKEKLSVYLFGKQPSCEDKVNAITKTLYKYGIQPFIIDASNEMLLNMLRFHLCETFAQWEKSTIYD